ncbi:hypothetical protein EJ06DRAFT_450405, partial [Trichodelitschia bisporula]
SLTDATLDQQCTVTRPGAAPIASALLVELLVSVLQHPKKGRAPATTSAPRGDRGPGEPGMFKHPLGAVPHTIRGYLGEFNNMCVTGQPYDCCSACSDTIVGRYQAEGWEFVKRAINEKGWVEDISGLAEVQRRAEEVDGEVDWEEEEEG